MCPSRMISALAGTLIGTVLQSTSRTLAPRSSPANWYSEIASGTGATAAMMVPGSAPMATAAGSACGSPAPDAIRLAC